MPFTPVQGGGTPSIPDIAMWWQVWQCAVHCNTGDEEEEEEEAAAAAAARWATSIATVHQGS